MWRTDTHWFDVAITMTVLMVGQLCFGRFLLGLDSTGKPLDRTR
jgi:hypothetical protein